MNVLIVFAHPELRSFNGELLHAGVETLEAAGHQVTVSDLYRQGFSAAAGPADFLTPPSPEQPFSLGAAQMAASASGGFSPELAREIARLKAADLLILQFPLWWFSMPAILKGWIDRVLAFGTAYGPGQTWDQGLMRGRRAMLSLTASAPESSFLPDGRNGDLERILWPIHAGILRVCGYQVLRPFTAFGVPFAGPEAMARQVDDWKRRLAGVAAEEPLFFHPASDIGPDYRLRPEVEPATPGQHRGPRRHWPAGH